MAKSSTSRFQTLNIGEHSSLPAPKFVSDLNENVKVEIKNVNQAVLNSDQNGNQTYRSKLMSVKKMRNDLPEGNIIEIMHSIYSTKEIDDMAVVDILVGSPDGNNSVRDRRLGPTGDPDTCGTCNLEFRECVGHYGKIVIPKMMHPLAISQIINILSSVCNDCGQLLVKKEDIYSEGINRLSENALLKGIRELSDKHGKCNGTRQRECKQPNSEDDVGIKIETCKSKPLYEAKVKDDHVLTYRYSKGGDEFRRTADSIYEIFDCISDEDAKLLGFKGISHPRDLIMERMVVIPYCARPDLIREGVLMPDDLTTMYIQIIKLVNQYKGLSGIDNFRAQKSTSTQTEIAKSIFFVIHHFMQNDGRYKQGQTRPFCSLKDHIQGKEGIVRHNLQSKRVDFAGRTVIAPGPNLRVDQVGVPRLLAEKITRPIMVRSYNIIELQKEFMAARVHYITMAPGMVANLSAGVHVRVNSVFHRKFPNYHVRIGDKVERQLKDGDIVILNRQPTLHKQNMIALRVKIIEDRVIRINLSVTTPQNADFDGDEMNMHVPQTVEAYSEAEELMGTGDNLLSEQKNRPMMGIVMDSLTSAFLLSDPNNQVGKINPDGSVDQEDAKFVFEDCVRHMINTPQYDSLNERLIKYGIPLYSGIALISATFPDTFFYDNKGVFIREGILLAGRLTKETLGTSENSIIGEMVKQESPSITIDFMSNIQFITNDYLTYRGFTIGYDDCVNNNADFKSFVENEIENAKIKVLALSSQHFDNDVQEAVKERKINEQLGAMKGRVEKESIRDLPHTNALSIMAKAGSKGTEYNTAQITSTLGQQMAAGKRIPALLPGNRTLPIFPSRTKDEPEDPIHRGLGINSYSRGLTMHELFFHMYGSREGLTDTAINTAETGNLQRRTVKFAEDITISPDGSVRGPDDVIISFLYGEDGYNAGSISTYKIGGKPKLWFANMQNLADKVSYDFVKRNGLPDIDS